MASLLAQQSGQVVLDGRLLWVQKTSRDGFNAAERAADIRANLLHVAEDPRRSLDDVREISSDVESILLVSRVYLFSVTDEDAAAEAKPREQLFAERRKIALDALQQYRHAREYSTLLRSLLKGTLALALAVAALWLLWKAYGRVAARTEWLIGRLSSHRRLASVLMVFERALIVLLRVFLRVLFAGTGLLIAFLGFSYLLALIPASSGIAGAILSTSLNIVRQFVSAVVGYLPNLLVLLLVGLLTYLLIRAARAIMRAVDRGEITIRGFHRDWAKPTYDLIRILLILFALVVAFPYLPGGDSPALRGASLFIGVLVSLGSGSAMGNVISGVMLTYMRPFQLGDRVRIADTEGDIVEKSLLVTRIRTTKNLEIVVPNSAILAAHIVNYSTYARTGSLIVHTTVTIGYDVPWRQVQELLERAAARTEHILAAPPPFVLQTSLNDYHVSYQLNAYTREANRLAAIYSDLHRNIQEEFNAASVEIMSPGFVAIRDGNAVTVPETHRAAGYAAPSFRVEMQSAPRTRAAAAAPNVESDSSASND